MSTSLRNNVSMWLASLSSAQPRFRILLSIPFRNVNISISMKNDFTIWLQIVCSALAWLGWSGWPGFPLRRSYSKILPEAGQNGQAGHRGVTTKEHDQEKGKNAGQQEGPDQGHPVSGTRGGHGSNAAGSDIVANQKESGCNGGQKESYFLIDVQLFWGLSRLINSLKL